MTSATTRKRNPRGQGGQLRDDLLHAAAELIAETGSVREVGIRAVASAVGVSPTAVYRHFDNVGDLLQASIDHCWTIFRDGMMQAVGSSEDPFEQFRNAGVFYLEFAAEHDALYRTMFRVPPDADKASSVVGMQAFDMLIAIVSAILNANGDDRDPHFVAVQVHTWVHGIAGLCVPFGADEAWPETNTLLDGLSSALNLDPA